jgi:hypothetical protein
MRRLSYPSQPPVFDVRIQLSDERMGKAFRRVERREFPLFFPLSLRRSGEYVCCLLRGVSRSAPAAGDLRLL